MQKPQNYDDTTAKSFGEFETLDPGGYICRILKADATKSKSGKDMLVLEIDVAEGESKGFFQRKLERESETNKEARWKCIYRQLTGGNSTGFFKGLITAIEESNRGYTWNWEEKTLEGKIVGGVFGREQWEYNGKTGFKPEIKYVCSIETIKKGVKAPEDKLLENKDTLLGDGDFMLMDDLDMDCPF